MRPLVKPLVAVVAVTLATSASAAASSEYKGSAAMGSSCGPVLDTKMSRAMHVNSPARSDGSCWQDRFAYGGDVIISLMRADDVVRTEPTGTFFNVRAINLYTDVMLNKQMAFHVMISDESVLNNNMPLSGSELDGSFEIMEAYLTVSDFMKMPIYIKAGRSYTPFGNYSDPFPTVFSINQGYVQAYNTNLTLGFVSDAGYDVSAFIFQNESSDDWDEFGFRVGYQGDLMGVMKGLNFNINASYVDNYSAYSYYGTASVNDTDSTHPDLNESVFDIQTGISLRNFNLGLEYFRANGSLTSDAVKTGATSDTTTPKILGVTLSYDFLANGKKADAHAMYEKASDGSDMKTQSFNAVRSAEKHYNLGMNLDLAKNAVLSLDYHRFVPFDAVTYEDQKQVIAAMKVTF